MKHGFTYEKLIETDVSFTPKLTGDYKSAIITTFHRCEYETRDEEVVLYVATRRDWNYYGSSLGKKLPQPYMSDTTSRISEDWTVINLTLRDYILGNGSQPEYMGDVSSLSMDCVVVATYFNDDDTITNECIG